MGPGGWDRVLGYLGIDPLKAYTNLALSREEGKRFHRELLLIAKALRQDQRMVSYMTSAYGRWGRAAAAVGVAPEALCAQSRYPRKEDIIQKGS